jgi:hypothetical protein
MPWGDPRRCRDTSSNVRLHLVGFVRPRVWRTTRQLLALIRFPPIADMRLLPHTSRSERPARSLRPLGTDSESAGASDRRDPLFL